MITCTQDTLTSCDSELVQIHFDGNIRFLKTEIQQTNQIKWDLKFKVTSSLISQFVQCSGRSHLYVYCIYCIHCLAQTYWIYWIYCTYMILAQIGIAFFIGPTNWHGFCRVSVLIRLPKCYSRSQVDGSRTGLNKMRMGIITWARRWIPLIAFLFKSRMVVSCLQHQRCGTFCSFHGNS